jgi:hypothetical protein
MGESFGRFLVDHPFWAVFIAVFMILPMIGAVIHIILKALGKRGIDNSPPSRRSVPPSENDQDSGNDDNRR